MAIAIDPVCHMEVDTEAPAGGQTSHDNADYYFCAPGCKVVFDRDPEKYLSEDYQPMEMSHEEPLAQPRGGILGYFRRLFGMQSDMD